MAVLRLLKALAKWLALGAWVGLLSGAASALFLHALGWATGFREAHPAMLLGLPLAGAAIALVPLTGQPVGFFAALGFVAVFAGAAKTPLTCVVLGIELFGAKPGVPLAAACLLNFVTSGRPGIYAARRRESLLE